MRSLTRKLALRARRRGTAIAVGLTILFAHPVWAASLSAEDLRILVGALAFVQPRPSGDGVVAIVYAGQDSASHQDAEAILAEIGKDLPAAGAQLTPRLVDVGNLASSGFNLVIVARGANSDAVSRAMGNRHALCVTADPAAVRQGFCAMAIQSSDKIEILLNHQAALDAGVTIATAFRMMVVEL